MCPNTPGWSGAWEGFVQGKEGCGVWGSWWAAGGHLSWGWLMPPTSLSDVKLEKLPRE